MLRSLIAILLLATTLSAQQAAPPSSAPAKPSAKPPAKLDKATEKELARWLERARYWTDAATEEEWRLTPEQRTLFHARLAQVWWKTDPPRARRWLDAALHDIEQPPANESEEVLRKRMEAARWLLGFLGDFDPPSRRRVLNVLVDSIVRSGGAYNSQAAWENVDWLQGAAGDIIQTEPAEAAKLIERVLPYANGNYVQGWLPNLYLADPSIAMRVHREAITTLEANRQPDFAFGLVEAVWPVYGDSLHISIPPDLQQATVRAAAQIFMQRIDDDPTAACTLAPDLVRLAAEIPPEQLPQVQAAVGRCKASAPEWQKQEVSLQEKQLKTADDFLAAAASEPAVAVRARLKRQGAILLERSDPARALEVVDSFTEEELKADSNVLNLRSNMIHKAVAEMVKAKDYQRLQALIDRASHSWRLEVLTGAAQAAVKDDDGFARTLYTEARRELADTSVPQPFVIMQVLQLASALAPEQEAAVQREVYAAINNMPPDDRKKPGVHYFPLWHEFGPTGQPASLLDLDDGALKAAVDTLDAPQYRVAFRLSMARACTMRRAALLQDTGLATRVEDPHRP